MAEYRIESEGFIALPNPPIPPLPPKPIMSSGCSALLPLPEKSGLGPVVTGACSGRMEVPDGGQEP